ncbi:MAG TPA: hypothetical protein VN887_18975 [Candidatus Angelobacter sp.]|nr:hypothetical protein [Candidatus Angelobacter sp.]
MKPLVFTIRRWGLATVLCLVAHSSAAGLRLSSETTYIAEVGLVTNYSLTGERRRLSFIPPPGWSVKPDASGKTIQLIPQNLNAGITLRITLAEEKGRPSLDPNKLREVVLERYPGARITNQFTCYTSAEKGIAFDFERTVQTNTRAAGRMAFVSFDAGTIEFELTTLADKLPDYRLTFGAVMTSFHVEPFPDK